MTLCMACGAWTPKARNINGEPWCPRCVEIQRKLDAIRADRDPDERPPATESSIPAGVAKQASLFD